MKRMKRLTNGVDMPVHGLGVYKMLDEEEAYRAIRHALDVGYRAIDTAAFYHNEEVVGRAIRESGIPRDELFVTTKVWNDDAGYESTLRAFDASLDRLGLEYVDAYLTHWPVPGQFVETYRAILQLERDERIRVAGVCNHNEAQLETLYETFGVYPNVNQVEMHPYLQQRDLQSFCDERNIAVTAWAPLGRGKMNDDPTITAIAAMYGKTAAQVILRWHLQCGRIVIPKSVTPSRIEENRDVFDFSLDDASMLKMSTLERNGRTGADPSDPHFMDHFQPKR